MLIYGIALIVVLLGCCGLTIDLGQMEITKIRMQTAADAAAMGGALANQSGGNFTSVGTADAAQNGFTSGANQVLVTLTNPPASGSYAGNSLAVQATITKKVHGIFLPKSFTLQAQSTALSSASSPCVYALSQTKTPSMSFTNQYISSTCAIYLGQSYTFAGNSGSTGTVYYVNGPSSASSGSVSPAPVFNAPSMSDPLSALAAPSFGACNHTKMTVNASTTLSPGTYCGGLTISTSGNVTLNPGMYIILGALTINGPNLTGSGVTFYVSQGSGYSYGASSIQNVNATLSAPTSGTWQGIFYYSDRTLPMGQAGLSVSNFNPGTTIDGVFYLAGQQFYSSNATLQGNRYFGLVADDFHLQNSNFSPKDDYSSLAGGSPFQSSGGVGLVE